MTNKICKKCGDSHIKKDGFKRGKQRYKCCSCGFIFQNKSRDYNSSKMRNEYTEHKQTYKELGEKYKESTRTISRQLDKYRIKKEIIKPQSIVLIIDTTYFGRSFGIMVFRSYELKKNLLRKEVKRETLEEYKLGIQELKINDG